MTVVDGYCNKCGEKIALRDEACRACGEAFPKTALAVFLREQADRVGHRGELSDASELRQAADELDRLREKVRFQKQRLTFLEERSVDAERLERERVLRLIEAELDCFQVAAISTAAREALAVLIRRIREGA